MLGLVPVVAALPALALLGWTLAVRPTVGAMLAAVAVATVAYVVGYALLVLGASGRSASACAPGTTLCRGGWRGRCGRPSG
ncbi:hypothetical protein NKG94_01200 [Micromonospora sp. M12]